MRHSFFALCCASGVLGVPPSIHVQVADPFDFQIFLADSTKSEPHHS